MEDGFGTGRSVSDYQPAESPVAQRSSAFNVGLNPRESELDIIFFFFFFLFCFVLDGFDGDRVSHAGDFWYRVHLPRQPVELHGDDQLRVDLGHCLVDQVNEPGVNMGKK